MVLSLSLCSVKERLLTSFLDINSGSRAMAVAHLIERSLPIPEIRGSSPVIGNFLKRRKKKTREGMAHSKKSENRVHFKHLPAKVKLRLFSIPKGSFT